MSAQRPDKESKAHQTHRQPQIEDSTKTPEALDLNNVVDLQSVIGNQGVQRLMRKLNVQTKLTVGPAGDQYEQEADSVASQVMSMPDSVQRIGEEDELQMKRVQRASEEDELQMKPIQRVGEEDELQMKPIQRASPEEDELQMKPIQRVGEEDELQMKSQADAVPEVTDEVESSIEGARGSGTSMPDSAREFFEPRFGQDFSGVNIHTGSEADTLNRSLDARAFTTGSDIFFRSGEYNPESSEGRELIAHELTHVVQQGGSEAQRKEDDAS